MSPLRAKAPKSREKRHDTLGAWLGSHTAAAAEFAGAEVNQRIRTFAQSSHDDLLYALRLLSGFRNSVTVVHGPRGCAAAGLYHQLAGSDTRWAVTDLGERDTVMGADGKLRKAVVALHRRHRPEVIFVVANPVVAINNDDIQSVIEELHEELELPIVPIYVTGFASRTAATGYDTALHALLKYLVGPPKNEAWTRTVNLLAVVEEPADRAEAGRLLAKLGLTVNLLPDGADLAAFREAARARLSIPLSPDTPEYLGVILEEKYGVPFVEAPRPVGIGSTGRWLAAVGAALGLDAQAEELRGSEERSLKEELGDFSLQGVRVYLGLSASNAFSALELIEELGGEVVGVTISHLDRLHTQRLEELSGRELPLQIHVADGQPFEEVSIVRKLAPDLYIGDAQHLGQIGRLGIPLISLESTGIVGYAGVSRLVRRISLALKNRAYASVLSRTGLPYLDGWFKRSHNWHIKQEVK
jgi:nitrogenase molybdenum-cofactor synthesis protein NifE